MSLLASMEARGFDWGLTREEIMRAVPDMDRDIEGMLADLSGHTVEDRGVVRLTTDGFKAVARLQGWPRNKIVMAVRKELAKSLKAWVDSRGTTEAAMPIDTLVRFAASLGATQAELEASLVQANLLGWIRHESLERGKPLRAGLHLGEAERWTDGRARSTFDMIDQVALAPRWLGIYGIVMRFGPRLLTLGEPTSPRISGAFAPVDVGSSPGTNPGTNPGSTAPATRVPGASMQTTSPFPAVDIAAIRRAASGSGAYPVTQARRSESGAIPLPAATTPPTGSPLVPGLVEGSESGVPLSTTALGTPSTTGERPKSHAELLKAAARTPSGVHPVLARGHSGTFAPVNVNAPAPTFPAGRPASGTFTAVPVASDVEMMWPALLARLHNQLAQQCTDPFLRGDFDETLRAARSVLAQAIASRASMQGDIRAIIDRAFARGSPLLKMPQMAAPPSPDVQGGWRDLFAGCVEVLAVPAEWEPFVMTRQEAYERLAFASMLLRVLERTRPA